MLETPYLTGSDRFETVGVGSIEGWSLCSGEDCGREMELEGGLVLIMAMSTLFEAGEGCEQTRAVELSVVVNASWIADTLTMG